MPDVVEPRCFRDVAEVSVPVVLEEHVAAAHRRDVQIRMAVVVDVGKRRGYGDLARDPDAGGLRDVLEPAAAEIPPQLIAADLTREIHVEEAVAVDVRDRDAVPVIVVDGLVRLARVGDDVVLERDAALGEAIGELEIVENRGGARGFGLLVREPLEPYGSVVQIGGDEAFRHRARSLRVEHQRRRRGKGSKEDRRGNSCER